MTHRPIRMLMVDDEPELLEIGSAMLQQLGYAVFTAEDGRRAIEVFREHGEKIECVLLDLSMPNLDGIQTYAELRKIKPDIRVILVSGYTEKDLESRLSGAEMAAFLPKPYDTRQLQETLDRVLG